MLEHSRDFEDIIYVINRFKSEKEFQIGVQLFKRRINATVAGKQLSMLAEVILTQLQSDVEKEFQKKYGDIDGELAIIGMGKLGGYELTFGSDLDLVFVYECAASEDTLSFNRLAQRFIGILSSLTKEGRLYEVDTRLRPSGKDGPLAVSLEAFEKYFEEKAWTFEFMALTRARVITGSSRLKEKITQAIHSQLVRERDKLNVARDVASMRGKIATQFPARNPWDIKYSRGGMMDIDFIMQFVILAYAAKFPALTQGGFDRFTTTARTHGVLTDGQVEVLEQGHVFLSGLLAYLRLCTHGELDEASAPAGLQKLLADAFNEPDFSTLKSKLLEHEAAVSTLFRELIESAP
jgi:glutamate-ammonia-ligase adenylyltransferase